MTPDLMEHAGAVVAVLWWTLGGAGVLILTLAGLVLRLAWPLVDSRKCVTKADLVALQERMARALALGDADFAWLIRSQRTQAQLLYELCVERGLRHEHCEEMRRLLNESPPSSPREDCLAN